LVACFWAGTPRRTPSFTTMLLGASIVVNGILLYDTYCREADQYSFAIRPQPVIEGFVTASALYWPLPHDCPRYACYKSA
jgi:hypothetical protein